MNEAKYRQIFHRRRRVCVGESDRSSATNENLWQVGDEGKLNLDATHYREIINLFINLSVCGARNLYVVDETGERNHLLLFSNVICRALQKVRIWCFVGFLRTAVCGAAAAINVLQATTI